MRPLAPARFGALDTSQPLAGLPILKCRINAKNKQDTTSGSRFGDARALSDLLQKVQHAGGVLFSDCAMGYYRTFAKSIKCTIDTTVDNFTGGRWSCVFTDAM